MRLETVIVTEVRVSGSPAGAIVTSPLYSPGAADSGTWSPIQSACTLPCGTVTVFPNARPIQSRPPVLKHRAAVAGIVAPPAVSKSENVTSMASSGWRAANTPT